jgi:hypothetical protein
VCPNAGYVVPGRPLLTGSIPAYIFAFLSLLFVLVRIKAEGLNGINSRYLYLLFLVGFLWLALLAASQLGHIIDNRRDFKAAYLVNNNNNTTIPFRSTLFTQSLYFAACVLIFLYFRFYFRDEWMKYVFIGGFLMAAMEFTSGRIS